MSLELMRAVWKHSKAKGTDRLVLIALADFVHSKDVDTCWPRVETIAKKVLLNVRATQYAIGNLIKAGELRVSLKTGRGQTNEYQILFSPTERVQPGAPPSDDQVVQESAQVVQHVAPPWCSTVHHHIEREGEREENGKEINKKSSRTRRALTQPLIPVEVPDLLKPFDAILRDCKGYQPTDRFFAFVLDRYSPVDRDLEADAIDIQDWLSKHPDRECSAGFLRRWLARDVKSNAPEPDRPMTYDEWVKTDIRREA